jgi:methylase of polypeptide subunit release factors
MQKDTGQAWQELCRRVYGNYQIYHQAGGLEQKARGPDEARFAPRSELIARHVLDSIPLPENGSALDIGCGNGAFLQGMIRCFPGWRVTGSDLNESFREQIVALGQQVSFKTQKELERGGETFEVV